MNICKSVKCQIKISCMVILTIIGLGLILPLPLLFVEAAPRDLALIVAKTVKLIEIKMTKYYRLRVAGEKMFLVNFWEKAFVRHVTHTVQNVGIR